MSSDRAQDDEPLIKADSLGKTYRMYRRPADRLWQALWPGRKPWFQDFQALEGVGFELRRGEVLGIVGVNGAGKSTLLQLVTGTISPTRGTVFTRGRVAALLELGSGFNPEFTGRENIYLNAATLGLDRAEIDSRMNAIIEFAGIGAHVDQPVKTYSSGMQIRLAFSIATSVEPDVLIIDEALSVGDGAFSRQSFDRIMRIKQSGATILFCSHVLFHVEAFCDRALWLHRGKVQMMGPVTQVLRPYQEFIDAYAVDPRAEPGSGRCGAGMHLADAGPTPEAEPVADAFVADERLMPPPDGPPTGALPDAGTPKGTARIECLRIRLDGQEGTELHGRSLSSRLEIEIGFASDPDLPAPTAALVLSSESGKILGSCTSMSRGIVFSRGADGSGVAQVALDTLRLNKGRYRVGVYLFCERGLHGYAMADPAAHISLEHAGFEQGAWLLEGGWSDGLSQAGSMAPDGRGQGQKDATMDGAAIERAVGMRSLEGT